MTGPEFKKSIKADARSVEQIAHALGYAHRNQMYYLFKQRIIDDSILMRCRAIGIIFPGDKTDSQAIEENKLLREQVKLLNSRIKDLERIIKLLEK